MERFTINFDEIAVICTRTKAQVTISEEDYLKLQLDTLSLEDILEDYEADYGEPNEEDYEVEELQIVDMFPFVKKVA